MRKSTAARRATKESFHVRLRDAMIEDAEVLEAWAADPEARGEFNDFSRPPSPVPREKLAEGGLRDELSGLLIVERLADRRPLGTVSWHRVAYGPLPESGAWNIGIALLPEARGKGYGAEAQRLLANWLFAHTDVNRVEASTDVENVAEQRALEKAGYVREGIQRGAQYRAGTWHDLVAYSRLRSDREGAPLPTSAPTSRRHRRRRAGGRPCQRRRS